MKILVTGGAGFIGSHVTDGLIRQGHDVSVMDNLSIGRMEYVNPKATFYLMDIRAKEVEKVFQYEQFDLVCHHAAQMNIRVSVDDPTYDADVNILGTLNILQNCVRFGVKKCIFASTGGAVYGEQQVFPCDEIHPNRPISPYGVGKLTVEKYLYYFGEIYGLRHVILRYANIYGPRQNALGEAGVVAIFCHKLIHGEQPIINGDGKQTRDYVYVEDVVQANLKSLHYEKDETFNVGTGIETDVNTLFDHINEMTGSKVQPKHGAAKPGEQRRSVISHKKAEKLMGWKPDTKLIEGLKRTVDYFRKNPE